MICTKTDALESFMKKHLDDNRYEHSLGVERMARKLAGIYGCDEEKTAFAGRYHDIAKCFDQETMDEYVRKYGLNVSLIGNKSLAHSKVGAAILEHEFGVTDEDVLEMVRWHTTGKAGMNTGEEILYVSDAIEDGRGYAGLKALQKLAYEDLDAACIAIMEFAIDDILAKGKVLDKDTIEARDYIITKINTKDRREND